MLPVLSVSQPLRAEDVDSARLSWTESFLELVKYDDEPSKLRDSDFPTPVFGAILDLVCREEIINVIAITKTHRTEGVEAEEVVLPLNEGEHEGRMILGKRDE